MKVLVNGGINLSELDGWWAEAYTTGCGVGVGGRPGTWRRSSMGRCRGRGALQSARTGSDPEFYARDANGIPTAWIKRMRESMALLTPRFSADRTVREYTEQRYLPAATAFRERAATKGAVAGRLSIGSTRSSGAGGCCASERCGSIPARSTTCLKSNLFLNDLDRMRCELNSMQRESTARIRCGRQ